MKKYIFLSLLTLLVADAYCSTEFTGTRAAGMGEAFTAVSGDIGGVYHNPAGIAGCDTSELNLNLGSFYDSGALGSMTGMVFTWPWANMDARRLAVHWNNRNVGPQSLQETGITLAKNSIFINHPFRWGSTLKWRSDNFKPVSGIMFDFGAQSDIIKEKVTVGASLNNFMSPDKDLAESSLACGLLYSSIYGNLTSDFKYRTDRFYLSFGWERNLYEGLLVTRLGILNAPDSYLTAGLSTNLWPIAFDISFMWPYNSTGGSGYFQGGFRYRFGGAHFSETYLDRSIEKAAAIEYSIKKLELKRIKLAREIIKMDEFKKNPNSNILAIPGVNEEMQKKNLPEKPKEPVKMQERYVPEKKVITWPQHHKVVPGDTLRSLAQKYYDDPNKWQYIFNANKDKVERGQPRIGEELLISQP
jgi:LysM repeat protein